MKRLLQILFLSQFVLFSCNERKSKKPVPEKKFQEEKAAPDVSTVENQSNASQIKKFGTDILENKVQPSDDNETFECINQLFNKDKSNLEFYFSVFRVIVEKSDGSLSEAIGLEIMKFLKTHPDFFIEKYPEFKRTEKNRFINFLAYEFYFMEPEHNMEIDKYFSEVNSLFESTTEPKRKYLNAIKELTKKATEEIIIE